MKKGLKALILCGLTSLMVFTAVCVSPIISKASQPLVYPIISEVSEETCGTVTYTVGNDVAFGRNIFSITGYYVDSRDVAIELAVYANPIGDGEGHIYGTYDFDFAGKHYSGTVELFQAGYDDEEGAYAYYFIGIVTPSDSSATGYYKQINDLKDLISRISNDSTLTGDARVIEFNVGTALPKDVIKALANSDGVNLKFTFVYKGFEFCTTITSEDAKRIYNPEIEWYGPCFLAENCPTVWTGKTVA